MQTQTSFRSLNIFYPENNVEYKKIEQLIKQSNITKLLQDNYINVFTIARDDINKLVVHLYDFNMMPIAKFNEFNENTINTIINLCNNLTQPTINTQNKNLQGGGKINYEYKYEKYKSKCDMMKGVITKLY